MLRTSVLITAFAVLAATGRMAPAADPATPAVPRVTLPPGKSVNLRLGRRGTEYATGGKGRYLVICVDNNPQINALVIDLRGGVVVGSVYLGDKTPLFAVDDQHLYFVRNYTREWRVDRYDLETMKKGMNAALPVAEDVLGIAVHPAGGTPIMISTAARSYLLDPQSLQEHRWSTVNHDPPLPAAARLQAGVRPGEYLHFLPGEPARKYTVNGLKLVQSRPSHAYPLFQSDGRLHLDGQQMRDGQGTALGTPLAGAGAIPAIGGPFVLSVRGTGEESSIAVHVAGEAVPLFDVVPETPESKSKSRPAKRDELLPNQCWLNAELNVLAVVRKSKYGTIEQLDSLTIYPLDVREHWRKQTDGPAVRLLPTLLPDAVRGRPYSAKVDLWSRSGQATMKLASGPPGLTLGDMGTITWNVPAEFAAATADVAVAINDAGQDTTATLRVPVVALAAVPDTTAAARAANPDVAKLELPSPTDHICAAGAGRYLLLSLPKENAIAVFDAAAKKIVKQIGMAEEGFLVAGGREHFYVLLTGQRILIRYSLKTMTREWAKPIPMDFLPVDLVMGSASDGPLAIVRATNERELYRCNVAFLDPDTLRFNMPNVDPKNYPGQDDVLPFLFPVIAAPHSIRAAAKGKLFAWSDSGDHRSGTGCSVSFLGAKPVATTARQSAGMLIPSASGRRVYSSHGIHDAQLNLLRKRANPESSLLFPADTGMLYLDLQYMGQTSDPTVPQPYYTPNNGPVVFAAVARFYLPEDDQPLAELRKINGLVLQHFVSQGRLTPDMRIHLMPDHGCIAALGPKNDVLVVHSFDWATLLAIGGHKGAMVLSEPPASVVRGGVFEYTPVVTSSAGALTVQLESGPPGMSFDNGMLKWPVPKDFKDADAAVLMVIRSKDGEEKFMNFRIAVISTEPVAPPGVPNTTPPSLPGTLPKSRK